MPVQEGDIVKGVVSDITHFGAFVKLETGDKGLIHISEIADTYVRNVSDYLMVNDEVTVKVIAVKDRGKIDLSIRRLTEGEGKPPAQQPTGSGPPRPASRPPARPPARPPGRPPARPSGRPPARPSHRQQASSPPRVGRGGEAFEDKLTSFLKKSSEKLSDVKKRSEKRSRGRRK